MKKVTILEIVFKVYFFINKSLGLNIIPVV